MRFCLLLFLIGCAAPADAPIVDEPLSKEIKEMAAKAETVYGAFSALLDKGSHAKAYLLLSADAKSKITEEEFVIAMTSFDEMRRMMVEAQVHDVKVTDKAGVLRICNPEFGLSEEFRIVWFVKIWTFDLTSEQIKGLTDKVIRWYDTRSADGGRHVFPSGYPHPSSLRRCPCGQ
jgi:hypothetical protein